MNKIKIMIADDHALMREGLAKILEMEDNFEVVFKAADGYEALDYIEQNPVDIVLLDINMPNMNGIETLKKMKQMDFETKIIMLTVYDTREYLIETLNLGANGYMLKDAETDSLVKAIEAVYNGGSYIHPNLAGELFKEINRQRVSRNIKSGVDSLTRREYEVLLLIAEGMSNKDISDHLVISEKTVKNHVSSILRKLDLQDRTQAAIFAIKQKLTNS